MRCRVDNNLLQNEYDVLVLLTLALILVTLIVLFVCLLDKEEKQNYFSLQGKILDGAGDIRSQPDLI